MSGWRRYPAFVLAILLLGLVVLVEAGWLAQRWRAARAAGSMLGQAEREWRGLTTRRPSPTPGNAALIEADLNRCRAAVASLEGELSAAGPEVRWPGRSLAAMPRADVFFDLAALTEDLRTKAQQAGVGLRPAEHFGFGAYAHEAPEAGQVATVLRERRIAQYLLEALFAARPTQLLAVQREVPPGSSGRRSPPAVTGDWRGKNLETESQDYFELDPRISLRVPGMVETTALRISFTGQTAVLRRLLNQLAARELPVVVRAVEVEPADRTPGGARSAQNGPAPLVTSARSRFTVTVEFISLAPQPASAS